MSKAGPLARSKSKRAKPTESTEPAAAAGIHGWTSPFRGTSVDVKPAPPRGDLGRRLHSDEIVIGLALGSPGQSPLPPLPPGDRDVQIARDFDIPDPCISPENTASVPLGNICEVGVGIPEIKRKGSKWKTFGSLFGRKDSATRALGASSFYQLDRIPEQGPARQHITQDHIDINVLRRKRAGSSRSNKTQTDSAQPTTRGESMGVLRRNSSRRKGLRRRKVEEMKPEMLRLHNALSAHAEVETLQPARTALRPLESSLLQVEIPNVELERYSVMFGDVLDFGPLPKLQRKPQPSLLARRQGHLEELQAVGDSENGNQSSPNAMPKLPHRRDGSISSKSSKSPSFSLFPSPTPRQSANSTIPKPIPKPSPLSRSTTAPNTLAPPDRPKIHKSKSQDQDHVLVIVHSPTDLPSTPTSHRRKLSSNPSFPSANSTQTNFLECAEFTGYPYPTVDVDPPLPTTGAKEAFLQRAFPARKSSMKKLQLPPEGLQLPRRHASDSMSTMAEVSIARQISISRRQRQLLVPIAPKLARQPMQPTLVKGTTTPASRKSHHPTLEDA